MWWAVVLCWRVIILEDELRWRRSNNMSSKIFISDSRYIWTRRSYGSRMEMQEVAEHASGGILSDTDAIIIHSVLAPQWQNMTECIIIILPTSVPRGHLETKPSWHLEGSSLWILGDNSFSSESRVHVKGTENKVNDDVSTPSSKLAKMVVTKTWAEPETHSQIYCFWVALEGLRISRKYLSKKMMQWHEWDDFYVNMLDYH